MDNAVKSHHKPLHPEWSLMAIFLNEQYSLYLHNASMLFYTNTCKLRKTLPTNLVFQLHPPQPYASILALSRYNYFFQRLISFDAHSNKQWCLKSLIYISLFYDSTLRHRLLEKVISLWIIFLEIFRMYYTLTMGKI